MAAIEARGLGRVYGRRRGGSKDGVHAPRDVDFVVEPGEVRGLLGPNGAGKTTLCRILCTVLAPTSGTARVLGHDVVRETTAVKRSVGIVFGGDRGLYGRLTARQNLQFWASLYGLHGRALRLRVDGLLERVGLTGRADERVDAFSRGMKQRLHLARGLVAEPPVLIMDEPTTGMDPVAAHDFRALVGELRGDRRTLLITTHDMAEAAAVCDQVTFIDHGRVLVSEKPAAIGALISRYERITATDVPAHVADALSALAGVVSVTVDGSQVTVETSDTEATRAVLQHLVGAGVTDLSTGRPSLEQVYLHVIGERGMAVSG